MTARPPHDEHDALDPEERGLATRLAASAPPGPSAALDARILAAARAATVATPAARRPARRWPTAVGAAATLVIAVGLAWQLKPLIDMPAPLRPAPTGAPAEIEVLAEARPAEATAPPAMPAVGDAAAPTASARVATPAPQRSTASARVEKVAPSAQPAPAAPAHDYLDEAIGDHAHAPVAAAAAPPPPPAPEARLRFAAEASASAQRQVQSREEAAANVAGALGPVSIDAALPPLEWLERIRARRDAGDLAGARESLRRFLREHPSLRVPDDLRPLRAAQP